MFASRGYQDDSSPQRHRDASGVEHEWDGEHSGEAWQQGPVIARACIESFQQGKAVDV